MAYIKRQWKPLTLVSLVLVVGIGFWVYRSTATEAAIPAALWSYTPPTDVERSQIEDLLATLSLDTDAMIALNLTAAQAEDVLAAVRTFNTQNRTTLDTRLAAVAAERSDLRNLETSIRNGTAGQDPQSQWSTAVQDLASAAASYHSSLDSLQTTVSGLLSASQRTTWTAIQGGFNGPMPLRMLALSGQQRQDLSAAKQGFDHALAEAESDQQRASAVSTWDGAVESILSAEQETVVSAYRQNCATASANVAAAMSTVLPEE